MKKIMILLITLLMVSGVFAQGTQGKDLQTVKSEIQGLENSVLKFQSQDQQQLIEQVMNKIQTKDKLRLQNATFSLECKNETQLETCENKAENKEQEKLFGFLNMNRNVEYNIDANGTLTRESNFFDFMFKKEVEI